MKFITQKDEFSCVPDLWSLRDKLQTNSIREQNVTIKGVYNSIDKDLCDIESFHVDYEIWVSKADIKYVTLAVLRRFDDKSIIEFSTIKRYNEKEYDLRISLFFMSWRK